MPEETQASQSIQANENSIAIGGISIGGNVGDIRIGHTIGFTSDQVSTLITQISTTFQVKPFDGRCPYKGLEVFSEEDSELFFGREKWVENLMGRVKESRTLFVTGQSGSGKSSLVRAGLIPTLKKTGYGEHWLYGTLKPGRDPVDALGNMFSRLKDPSLGKYLRENAGQASVLHECAESVLSERADQRLVLFLDQFEEVFTQLSKDKAQTFINLLAHAATVENGRVLILFSMRSDFVPNCATYPQLNDLLNQQFVQIGAMQPEELVSAIAQPALRVGLKIDPDLIAQIINDMKGEPGALPLMQFALKDLFDAEQAKGGMIALTLSDYLEHGGINQALERHANASLEQLTDSEKELARSVFSGLIEIGRGTQDTRRTALSNELIPAGAQADAVKAVVQKLASARLITTDAATVTISHEKLIDAWPWLKKLVNENRDVIALQNEIAADAKEWEEHKRDSSYLYSGARLVNAREQLKANKLTLSGTANDFVQAGFAKQQREQRARIFSIAGVVALIIAGIAFFSYVSTTNANKLAKQSQNSANTQAVIANTSQANAVAAQKASTLAVSNEKQAKDQAIIALARQLAAQAQPLFASKPQIAVPMSVQSMRLHPSVEAAHILQTPSLPRQIAHKTHNGPVHSVAFSPDGKYVVSEGCDIYDQLDVCVQGSARVWSVTTSEEIASMKYEGDAYTVAFSPDGKYVVSEGCDQRDSNNACVLGSARVWETTTGKELSRMTHKGWVLSVAFSPDSKYVASGGADNIAYVWEVADGKKIATLTHESAVSFVIFSPDGKSIASSDNTVHIWDAANGSETLHISPFYGGVSSMAFSPDGKYLAGGFGFVQPRDPCICGGGGGGVIQIWDTTTGKEVTHMEVDNGILAISLSPDGKYLAAGTSVWVVATGTEIAHLALNDKVFSVAFSSDSKYVVTGSYDNTARVWEATSGKEVARMTHDGSVNSAAFSPDGKYVVSGSADGNVHVWVAHPEADTSKFVQFDNYSSITISPNGQFFLSSILSCEQYDSDFSNCLSSSASVWEVATGEQISHIALDNGINIVAFNPNNQSFVTSTDCARDADSRCVSTSVTLWEVKTGQKIWTIARDGYISAIAFNRDGQYLVSRGCESYDSSNSNICLRSVVYVWDATTGEEVVHKNYAGDTNFAVISPDGKYIVSGGEDKVAQLWIARTGKEVLHMVHNDPIASVAFSPDGKYIVGVGCDTHSEKDIFGLTFCTQSSSIIWAVETGKEVAHLTHKGEVRSTTLSPDSKYVVSLACLQHSADSRCTRAALTLWKANTGQTVTEIVYNGDALALTFSLDNRYMAIGAVDGTVRILEIASGKELVHMTHDSIVSSVAFSLDGKYIVSGSWDKTARVWDVTTGDEIARMEHSDNVYLVAIDPTGKYVISAESTATIIWEWQAEDLISNACQHMPRNFTRAEWEKYIGNILPYQAVCENLSIEPEISTIPTVSP